MKKNKVLFVLFIIAATSIFGIPPEDYFEINLLEFPDPPGIDEDKIPIPEVQYELPETLIGEFIMVTRGGKDVITIFPNNKYILVNHAPYHSVARTYGYIVKNDNKWYFSPSPKLVFKYFFGLTEIHFTESGFSFYDRELGEFAKAIRKENMPIPEHLAENVTVPDRITKRQIFILNSSGTDRIDFNEIETPKYFDAWYHRLRIDNGIVNITRIMGIDGLGLIVFEGFLEITEESADITKGIIRFTNGVPYSYINDGSAEIEINIDGSIIITMLYSPDYKQLTVLHPPDHELIKNYELIFPAKLVLEF